MKHEEALNKAYSTFRGDENDALLRLALLKERGDYRAFFAENIGKVKAAHSRRKEERAKGPGYTTDEETENTIRRFHEEMLRRFGILPSSYAGRPIEEWSSFFDPLTDAREAPETVRRYILPWLFYWPVVREVVSLTPPDEAVRVLKGRGECPRIVESAECAPYERLYMIDLRGKPAQILLEFKAALASVDACRKRNPAAYKEWKQDRTRKREEAWDYLKVWQKRRKIPMPSFSEIAKELPITPEVAKWRFYRAYEMIYGERFDRDAWEKDRAKEWEKHREIVPKTCKECPQRDSCTDADACPALFDEEKSTSVYLVPMGGGQEQKEGQDAFLSEANKYSYQDWLNREEDDKE